MIENFLQLNTDKQHLVETFGEIHMANIDETLKKREAVYGEFAEHARITQNIKIAMHDSINWGKLSPDKKEALDMIAHKVGRILNGDPEYVDSWHDIIGYTKLVENDLIKKIPLIP